MLCNRGSIVSYKSLAEPMRDNDQFPGSDCTIYSFSNFERCNKEDLNFDWLAVQLHRVFQREPTNVFSSLNITTKSLKYFELKYKPQAYFKVATWGFSCALIKDANGVGNANQHWECWTESSQPLPHHEHYSTTQVDTSLFRHLYYIDEYLLRLYSLLIALPL